MRAKEKESSPLTGIIQEDRVFVDFGEHEGKSIMEIADTQPDYYRYLVEKKNQGVCTLRRGMHKSFKLHMSV